MDEDKRTWLDRTGVIHLWNTIKAALDDKVNKIDGMGLSTNDYTDEEKTKVANMTEPEIVSDENDGLMTSGDKIKLDGIEEGATRYVHPTYDKKSAGLYRISVDETGHVATADIMGADELEAEGVSPVGHTHEFNDVAVNLESCTDALDDGDSIIVSHTAASSTAGSTDNGVSTQAGESVLLPDTDSGSTEGGSTDTGGSGTGGDSAGGGDAGSKPDIKYYRRTLSSLWEWIKEHCIEVFSQIGHDHDERYYTETEMDDMLSRKVGFGQNTAEYVSSATRDVYVANIEKEDIGIGNGTYYYVINLGQYSGGGFDAQIAVPYQDSISNSDIYIRTANKESWRTWRKLLNEGNYGSYALPLSGGTMTGNVSFSSIGDTATSSKITWDGSTDGADIYYQTTAKDQGNLVLNLRDDANCYLRIAYNGTFKSYFSPSDGNFHGNVNGKADTAGTADKANSVTWANVSGKPTIPAAAISASGNNYVRFSDGTQVCWGTSNPSSGRAVFLFPVAFANTSYFCCSNFDNGAADSNITNYSTTSAQNRTAITSSGQTWRYIAIGRWK